VAGNPLRVRVEATPGYRRLATVCLWLLGVGGAGFLWFGVRFLREFIDPACAEMGRALAIGLTIQVIPLVVTVIVVHDVAFLVVDVDHTGVRVTRWFRPFSARWDEVREIRLLSASHRRQIAVASARGSVTLTERLVGAASFAALTDILKARAATRLREISVWQVPCAIFRWLQPEEWTDFRVLHRGNPFKNAKTMIGREPEKCLHSIGP